MMELTLKGDAGPMGPGRSGLRLEAASFWVRGQGRIGISAALDGKMNVSSGVPATSNYARNTSI